MNIEEAIAQFRELHERQKLGAMRPTDRERYAVMRDEFARTFAAAQRFALRPGQAPRQTLRVSVAMKLRLTTTTQRQQETLTLDVGACGFAALVGFPMLVGTVCDFALGASRPPIAGRARVVACTQLGSGDRSYRVSLAVASMSKSDRERLEMDVLDAALAALRH